MSTISPLKRLATLFTFLCLVISFHNPSVAQSEAMPIEAYQDFIRETEAQLSSLQDLTQDQVQNELNHLADRWEGINQISLPNGVIIEIEHSFLVSQFRTKPPDLERLVGLIQTLKDTVSAWPTTTFSSDPFIPLQEILARPEYDWQISEPSAIEMWFEELVNRIIEFFERLVPGTEFASSTLLEPILLAFGIVIFLIILISAIRSIRTSFAPQVEAGTDVIPGEPPVTADEALGKALTFSNAGDYRNAVRYLYLSSLILLEERGVMQFDLSRTNREYIHDFAHRPEIVTPLGEVIDVFDRVWYGYDQIDAKAYTQYVDHVERLKQAS